MIVFDGIDSTLLFTAGRVSDLPEQDRLRACGSATERAVEAWRSPRRMCPAHQQSPTS